MVLDRRSWRSHLVYLGKEREGEVKTKTKQKKGAKKQKIKNRKKKDKKQKERAATRVLSVTKWRSILWRLQQVQSRWIDAAQKTFRS